MKLSPGELRQCRHCAHKGGKRQRQDVSQPQGGSGAVVLREGSPSPQQRQQQPYQESYWPHLNPKL